MKFMIEIAPYLPSRESDLQREAKNDDVECINHDSLLINYSKCDELLMEREVNRGI